MREWIDLVENKNRTLKTVSAQALPVWTKLTKENRERGEPIMFRECRDLIEILVRADPTNSPSTKPCKYFGWLLRRFAEQPWMEIDDYRGRRTWRKDWRKVDDITAALKILETGKLEPRDINAYKTVDALIAASKAVPAKAVKDFEPKLTWSQEGHSGRVHLSIRGKDAGSFVVDFTHKAAGKVSIHSFLKNEFQGNGVGHRVYGWIAARLEQKGYTLIPSDRLTDRAYGLWKKRAPDLLDGYVRVESRESPTGWLWLSPYMQRAKETQEIERKEREEHFAAQRAKATPDFYNHDEEMARATPKRRTARARKQN